MENEIKLIGEIDFKDIKVKVYNDPRSNDSVINCAWRMRNPDSCYSGVVFINYETGETTYPKDAVVPKQTKEDREMLPQFIITGREVIDDEFISLVNSHLSSSYKRRNP